jgi:CMD domain protein
MTTTPESTAAPSGAGGAGGDVILQLAGVAPGSAAAETYAQRPEVVRRAQSSYAALLEPDDPAGLSLVERAQAALRVALRTPSAAGADLYRARLADLRAGAEAVAAVERFPDGPAAPPRLAAILRHADRLTTAPREATPAHLDELKAAGLGPAEIVTLAQLIAFVTFQVRVAAALRVLAEGA